jgi:ubiquinone/menaquinone biosynthesis C-methylase UbiE
MTQKDVFLRGEGDAWFARNKKALSDVKLPDGDPLVLEILVLSGQLQSSDPVRVLEVGCGPGIRLAWLRDKLGFDCHGIDPSAKAVDLAASLGVAAKVGTADQLPYEDHYFDIVVFGFCLYLCDREDLFRIAGEADRVLKAPGWLLIRDFFSLAPCVHKYKHKDGVNSYKMDYRSLFTWHPDYSVFSHRVTHHQQAGYTDDAQEWVATSLLRKACQF